MQIYLIYYCFNWSEGSINTPVSQKLEFSGNYFMVQASLGSINTDLDA